MDRQGNLYFTGNLFELIGPLELSQYSPLTTFPLSLAMISAHEMAGLSATAPRRAVELQNSCQRVEFLI